jgi:rubrerythrin
MGETCYGRLVIEGWNSAGATFLRKGDASGSHPAGDRAWAENPAVPAVPVQSSQEAIDKANGPPYVVEYVHSYGAGGSYRRLATRETAERERANMKVQEYMLKALKDAVQMEVEGRQFYLEAAKTVKSPGVREIMEYLAESEKYHIEKFNEIYRSLEKDPAWNETIANFKPPQHEPYVCVMAMTKDEQGTGGDNDLQALKTGIKMEECSIDYYTKLAKEATNPLARRFFMSVAHEERGHYLTLMDMHNYLTLPEDWFYVTQMGHVDGA